MSTGMLRQSVDTGCQRPGGETAIDSLISDQAGLCFWCLEPIGDAVWNEKRQKWVSAKPEMDHVIPRCHMAGSDVVASCSICNGIKSDKLFQSIEAARTAIQERRLELGYRQTKGQLPLRSLPSIQCQHCGEPIKRKRRNQRFCSEKCRVAEWSANHPRRTRPSLNRKRKHPSVDAMRRALESLL